MGIRVNQEHSHRETAIRDAFGGVGHDVLRPRLWRAPVVFASPHSGNIYPDSFRDVSPLPLRDLRRNEDAHVDSLFAHVTELGAPLLRARFPRCYVDANRAGDDLPPEWRDSASEVRRSAKTVRSSKIGKPAKARSQGRANLGLGVVPLIINERLGIYRHPPSRAEVRARIAALHAPYHAELARLLEESHRGFGRALLVDCHSMPGFAAGVRRGGRAVAAERRADIILGDGHGRTAGAGTVDLLERLFAARGYRVGRNRPYAGGHTTLHYGQPDLGREAIQIEINRDLYLNAVTLAPKPGFERLRADLRAICEELMEAISPDRAEAAQ